MRPVIRRRIAAVTLVLATLAGLVAVVAFRNADSTEPVAAVSSPTPSASSRATTSPTSKATTRRATPSRQTATPRRTSTPTPTSTTPRARSYTYDVRGNGVDPATVAEFAATVAATYADARGWSRAGVRFRRVERKGAFTVVIAQAAKLPTYSAGCSSEYSCRAGRYVVVNVDRWRAGSEHFPGSLPDYRHMVINHETGHWLGLGHAFCSRTGAAAPLMQQQSKGMRGCLPNAWPLPGEIGRVAR